MVIAHLGGMGPLHVHLCGLGRAGEEAKGAAPALLSATALGGSLFMLAHLNFAKTSLLDKPQIDFSPEPNAVFWTANPSGYLVYLDIAYGATVMVADASTRKALLKAFGAEGLPQYFVADTPEINAIIVERQRMEKVGHLFGFNVYRENQSEDENVDGDAEDTLTHPMPERRTQPTANV
jgi:hypothetical protein